MGHGEPGDDERVGGVDAERWSELADDFRARLASVRRMPRAAAMLARPAVRQAARSCSTNSTDVGALSSPTRTAEWSASKVKLRS
jgi:hypothetical protein